VTAVARHAVRVGAPPDAAFEVFTTGIDRWWPLHAGFSHGGDRAQSIHLEARIGGRFYERFVDGDEFQVGEVVACEPPQRIVFTWRSPDWAAPTEVEVTFTADQGGTRVEVEHRGFERIGPGGDAAREGYAGGWATVLGTLVTYMEAAAS
jgi:uncharacterized protein YndB with AHSA1/START domain